MKNFKKALILLLTIVLTLSTFSVFAFASEGGAQPESNEIKISIDFSRFVASLQYLWMGMLCIFAVIGVIVLATIGLNKLSGVNLKRIGKNNRNAD